MKRYSSTTRGLLGVAMCLLAIGCADNDQGTSVEPVHNENPSPHPYLAVERAKAFSIPRDHESKAVPEDRVWAIQGHDIAQGKVTTADIMINGRASLQGYEFEGEFWLTFQQLQTNTLWLYSGTRITLGDTRPTLDVIEYKVLDRD